VIYRVFVYWLDEPGGFCWQIDDGDQENGDIYREVRFDGIAACTKINRAEPNAKLLARQEPKAWIEVHGAVLEAKDGVATFRRAPARAADDEPIYQPASASGG
jgi:hypothetical protein